MEQWLPIPGHDHYEVSDHGRVRSIPHYQRVRGGKYALYQGKILKPKANMRRTGHLRVQLNRRKNRQVHHLVLEAFVGPRPTGLLALHRDGNPANNHVDNLYWGTACDNQQDAVRHGTHHHTRRTECKRGHPLVMRPNGANRYCPICLKARYQRKGWNWKLTAAQAAAIAQDGRSCKRIAADYGIGSTTVHRIRKHGYSRI